MVSFSGGLLSLMMTGLVFVTINPGSIWVQFMFSEIISYLASSHKEGLRMITKKVFNEFRAYIINLRLAVQSWVAHHPSGLNPLTSL